MTNLENIPGNKTINTDHPPQVVGLLLRSLQFRVRKLVEDSLREKNIELSYSQLTAMFGLVELPSITGAELARWGKVSPQSMHSVLVHLESKGFTQRIPHPKSRRADSWNLTTIGSNCIDEANTVINSVFEYMLSDLSSKEVTNLLDYLNRCKTTLENPNKL